MITDFYSRLKPKNSGVRYGLGFKSDKQGPWFMVWKEYWKDGDVAFAEVLFAIG